MRKLLFLLALVGVYFLSCNPTPDKEDLDYAMNECMLTSYQMSDIYFSPKDTLIARVRIVEVSYTGKGTTDMSAVKKGLDLANSIFDDAKLKFELSDYYVVEDPAAAAKMQDFVYFAIDHNIPYALTIYIYPDDTFSGPRNPRGRASAAPGTFLAIKSEYVGTSTLAHELGHLVGLYHIFEQDEDPAGYNSVTGDLVCDTYGIDMKETARVNSNCKYIGEQNYPKKVEEDLVHNIMSYSNPKCRIWITKGQAKRIRAKIADSERVLSTMRVQPPS